MDEVLLSGLLVAATVAVVTSAAGIVACLGIRRATEAVLAIYLVAWAEVVVILLGLSATSSVTRWWTLAVVVTALGAVGLLWNALGRPRLPPIRTAVETLRTALIDPIVGLAAAIFVLVFAYCTALAVATPSNDGDTLAYHLARAAFWAQDQGVGYVTNPTDGRLGPNPPNSEIGQLFAIVLAGSDRYVALTQLLALPAAMLAVYATARRATATSKEALFGALLFGLLPVVVLQSATALNDLVTASFVVAAAPFCLTRERRSHLVAGLAVALAAGTKSAVPLLLVPLGIVIIAAQPFRYAARTLAILLVGVVVGSYWSIENLRLTGKLDGGLSEGQIVSHTPDAVFSTLGNLARRSLDLPGTLDWNLLYLVAAGVMLAIVAVGADMTRRPTVSRTALRAAPIVVAVPLIIALAAALTGQEQSGRVSDATGSWYGPAGILAVLAATIIVGRRWRARKDPPSNLALAAAPLIQLVLMGFALTYDPFRGRFLISAVALSAATWGVLLVRRPLALATTVLAATTIVLSLLTLSGKPSGLPLTGALGTDSVWGKPRWFVETALRPDGNERAILRFVDRYVPDDATVALAVNPNDFISPYFGHRVSRTVRLVPEDTAVPDDAQWLVIAADRKVDLCVSDWKQSIALSTDWRVLRRVASGTCRN